MSERDVDVAFRKLDRTVFTTNELKKRVRSAKLKANKKKGKGEL